MYKQVVAALRRLQREKRTGVFKTQASGVQREVVFESGAIVSAHSTLVEERLGEIMVRRGRISLQQLEDASKLMKGGKRRLGDALVELEIVQRDEVETFVRTQLAEIASKLLTEPSRKIEFHNGEELGRTASEPVLVADAILEAARHTSGIDEHLKAMMEGNLRPCMTPEATALLQTLSLKSHEAFILSRCDGVTYVRDIFAQSPMLEEETARVLLGLEQAGILEMKRASTAH